jgi:hypothetical protein
MPDISSVFVIMTKSIPKTTAVEYPLRHCTAAACGRGAMVGLVAGVNHECRWGGDHAVRVMRGSEERGVGRGARSEVSGRGHDLFCDIKYCDIYKIATKKIAVSSHNARVPQLQAAWRGWVSGRVSAVGECRWGGEHLMHAMHWEQRAGADEGARLGTLGTSLGWTHEGCHML